MPSSAIHLAIANNLNYLLPDGVADVLFTNAQKLENLRDALLFILTAHGYRLVSPPLIEYTETLLHHADEELKRQTFKFIDQMTGRLMGLRADITPQIARIDAQHGTGISRYCYIGQVVKTLPTGLFGLRTPMQLGAEIFGINEVGAELALMDLLAALFDEIDISLEAIHIDVGHVAIFDRLCTLHQLDTQQIHTLMRAYAKKDLPSLVAITEHLAHPAAGADFLLLAQPSSQALKTNPAIAVTKLLDKLSPSAQNDDAIRIAFDELHMLTSHIIRLGMSVSVDITDLSGYHYHTGLVFNGYLNHAPASTQTQALVRGGRYLANKSRGATGFSMDINRLLDFVTLTENPVIVVDFADKQRASDTELVALQAQIKSLQDDGCVVITPLNADDLPSNLSGVLALLASDTGRRQWAVRSVDDR